MKSNIYAEKRLKYREDWNKTYIDAHRHNTHCCKTPFILTKCHGKGENNMAKSVNYQRIFSTKLVGIPAR